MTLYLEQKKLLLLLVWCFLLGVLSGCLYDLLRTLRPRTQSSPLLIRFVRHFWVGISDFLFFTALGVADAIVFFVYHSGRVRISAFFMNALGFLLWRLTLSGICYPLFQKTVSLLTLPVRCCIGIVKKLRIVYEKKGIFYSHRACRRDGGDCNADLHADRPQGRGREDGGASGDARRSSCRKRKARARAFSRRHR
ncbi:MAG: spore cortex biosynthesis protein YabQ [Clostridia bacterium]|nr:spore cortex biosynthesis protein YabQ [Clostridia bacterium]